MRVQGGDLSELGGGFGHERGHSTGPRWALISWKWARARRAFASSVVAIVGAVVGAVGLSVMISGPVLADALERYLPVLPHQSPPFKAVTVNTPLSLDDKPIGPNLSAVVVTGLEGADLTTVIGDDPVNMTAQPLIGQPITPRLIGDVVSAVTSRYSLMGHAVMAEWVPEAGMASGVLMIRVTNIIVGDVIVKGATAQTETYLKRIRVI